MALSSPRPNPSSKIHVSTWTTKERPDNIPVPDTPCMKKLKGLKATNCFSMLFSSTMSPQFRAERCISMYFIYPMRSMYGLCIYIYHRNFHRTQCLLPGQCSRTPSTRCAACSTGWNWQSGRRFRVPKNNHQGLPLLVVSRVSHNSDLHRGA